MDPVDVTTHTYINVHTGCYCLPKMLSRHLQNGPSNKTEKRKVAMLSKIHKNSELYRFLPTEILGFYLFSRWEKSQHHLGWKFLTWDNLPP